MKPVFKIVPGAGPAYTGIILYVPGRNRDARVK